MDTNYLIQNGVDVEKGIEILGDIETYNEMLLDFLEEISEKLDNIKNAKESSDLENYAILTHSLKSDSKYFGFTKLVDLAYAHELASKENNINFVSENYDELINEANRIIEVVKNYTKEKNPV